MHKTMTRAALAALALSATGATSTPTATDAARWQAMARADLEAVHARIVEAHPGVIDAANPGFNTWVEQGYEQAKAFLPYVVSYDTAMAVTGYYTVGFQDGHLLLSDDIREDFPILVTGWDIAWKDGRYEVVAVLPDWSVPLPPLGAEWTGCDGLAAEDVMQTRVAPFSDRRVGDSYRDHRAASLWLRRPVAEDLRECSFRDASGKTLTLPVAYQPVGTDQFFAALPHLHDGGTRAANAFEVRDGVLWVRAGNFHLREGSGDQRELETMLAGLQQVHDVHAIVFDARGNGGGDSSIGDRIFEAATGGLDFDQTDLDALPRYYAQWRVSDFLVRSADHWIEETTTLYGADSPRVADQVAFRDRVVAARAAGQPWVEQDAGRTITRADVVARHGHLHRFDAKVALLTDDQCVSACLDFADVVLQVPGVVHVGETTGADSVYLVGSRSRMPSGNTLVMPVKVWRNRTRGNNQALVPDVPVDLDQDEATIRQDVLRALGLG
jgi:hypothetical protein